MKKLQALTQYLTDKGVTRFAMLDSWIEAGLFKPSARDEGDGLAILDFEYKGVIHLENYSGSAAALSAHIAIWLLENAEDYDSQEVEFDADKTSDKHFDIEVAVQLCEQVKLVPDENGVFELAAVRYALGQGDLWVAEAFDLVGEVC